MLDLFGKFLTEVRRERFFQRGDTLLVAVSGGVDSMVLLALCLRLAQKESLTVACAHINYRLRGKESEAQEALVRRFAKDHEIFYAVARPHSKKTKQNFQAFARDVRRDFLLKIAQKIRATHVVLGHHLEDQVETVMGHLLRGSGLHGLGAMGPMVFFEKIPWVRPLLSFQKKELYAYARKEKIPFIEDSSNKTFKYHRNRLRQELIPQLEKLSKGSLKRIASLSETSRLWGECMSSLAEKELKKSGKKGASGLTLDRGHLISLPKALRQELFRQAYIQMTGGSADLKRDHLEKMEALCLGDRPRSTYRLPKGLQWVREKEKLLFLNNSLC